MKIVRISPKTLLATSPGKPNIFYRLNFNATTRSSHFDGEAYTSEREARETESVISYPDFIIIEVDPN